VIGKMPGTNFPGTLPEKLLCACGPAGDCVAPPPEELLDEPDCVADGPACGLGNPGCANCASAMLVEPNNKKARAKNDLRKRLST
jgi:hypothetical protein